MKVVRYRGEAVPEEAVSRLIGSSFLASREFASLWAFRSGRRTVWGVEDDRDLVAALPGIEFGRWPVSRFMAMPNGLYGQTFLSRMSVGQAHAIRRELVASILTSGYSKVYLFDFFDSMVDSGLTPVPDEMRVLLVDISSPDWEPKDHKLRSEIRKAERDGVTAFPFDWETHGTEYLTLVKQADRDRDRGAVYPEPFWHSLAAVARADSRVRWYSAVHDGRLIASHVNFIEKDMLLTWQWYYDRNYSSLKANQYLIVHACREALCAGVRTLNLGATPGGAEGTDYFKRRWGGEEYRYRTLIAKRGIGRLL